MTVASRQPKRAGGAGSAATAATIAATHADPDPRCRPRPERSKQYLRAAQLEPPRAVTVMDDPCPPGWALPAVTEYSPGLPSAAPVRFPEGTVSPQRLGDVVGAEYFGEPDAPPLQPPPRVGSLLDQAGDHRMFRDGGHDRVLYVIVPGRHRPRIRPVRHRQGVQRLARLRVGVHIHPAVSGKQLEADQVHLPRVVADLIHDRLTVETLRP